MTDIYDLIGCTVHTHYGTGGKVIYVGHPYKDKSFLILIIPTQETETDAFSIT